MRFLIIGLLWISPCWADSKNFTGRDCQLATEEGTEAKDFVEFFRGIDVAPEKFDSTFDTFEDFKLALTKSLGDATVRASSSTNGDSGPPFTLVLQLQIPRKVLKKERNGPYYYIPIEPETGFDIAPWIKRLAIVKAYAASTQDAANVEKHPAGYLKWYTWPAFKKQFSKKK